MWTSTLRGCQATPVSDCVKLKHNHPRPSLLTSPFRRPSPPLFLSLFIFSSPFSLLRRCTSASFVYSFPPRLPYFLSLHLSLYNFYTFFLFSYPFRYFYPLSRESNFPFLPSYFVSFSSLSYLLLCFLSLFLPLPFSSVLVRSLALLSLRCLVFYYSRRSAFFVISLSAFNGALIPFSLFDSFLFHALSPLIILAFLLASFFFVTTIAVLLPTLFDSTFFPISILLFRMQISHRYFYFSSSSLFSHFHSVLIFLPFRYIIFTFVRGHYLEPLLSSNFIVFDFYAFSYS